MARPETVTIHIEDVPVGSITDALVAIEAMDMRHVGADYYDEMHANLTKLVLGLRAAQDSVATPLVD